MGSHLTTPLAVPRVPRQSATAHTSAESAERMRKGVAVELPKACVAASRMANEELGSEEVQEVEPEATAAGLEAHAPSAAADSVGVQQEQDVQPGERSTEVEQQQPPRHRSEAQSGETAHASPGERVRHEPVCSAHAVHPKATARDEQHAPLLHASRRTRCWLSTGRRGRYCPSKNGRGGGDRG